MNKNVYARVVALLLILFASTSYAGMAKYYTNLDTAIAETPDGQQILIDFYTDW